MQNLQVHKDPDSDSCVLRKVADPLFGGGTKSDHSSEGISLARILLHRQTGLAATTSMSCVAAGNTGGPPYAG